MKYNIKELCLNKLTTINLLILNIFKYIWVLINMIILSLITFIFCFYIDINNNDIRIDCKWFSNETDTNYCIFHVKKIK